MNRADGIRSRALVATSIKPTRDAEFQWCLNSARQAPPRELYTRSRAVVLRPFRGATLVRPIFQTDGVRDYRCICGERFPRHLMTYAQTVVQFHPFHKPILGSDRHCPMDKKLLSEILAVRERPLTTADSLQIVRDMTLADEWASFDRWPPVMEPPYASASRPSDCALLLQSGIGPLWPDAKRSERYFTHAFRHSGRFTQCPQCRKWLRKNEVCKRTQCVVARNIPLYAAPYPSPELFAKWVKRYLRALSPSERFGYQRPPQSYWAARIWNPSSGLVTRLMKDWDWTRPISEFCAALPALPRLSTDDVKSDAPQFQPFAHDERLSRGVRDTHPASTDNGSFEQAAIDAIDAGKHVPVQLKSSLAQCYKSDAIGVFGGAARSGSFSTRKWTLFRQNF